MSEQVIITIKDGHLSLSATPMQVERINLWLDVAKAHLLNKGPAGVEAVRPAAEVEEVCEAQAEARGLDLRRNGN